MSTEPESRLVADPEFQGLIEAAQALDVDDAWLDSQLTQILNKIDASPPDNGSSGGPTGGFGHTGATFLKLIAPLALGTGLYLALTPSEQPMITSSRIITENPEQSETSRLASPDLHVPPPSEIAAPSVDTNQAQERDIQSEQSLTIIPKEPSKAMQATRGLGRSDAPKTQESPPEVPASHFVSPTPPPPQPMITGRELSDILSIIEKSKTLAARGQDKEALALLEPLLTTPYRIEVLSKRAEIAYASGHYEIAIESLEKLIQETQSPKHTRRGLLRSLGDALAKSGECGRAILTYQKALALNPSAAEEHIMRAAVIRCQSIEK